MWTDYRFNKRVLGIAVGERSLRIAQVSSARPELLRAEFPYPTGVTLENPEALGLALSSFLREKGFTARHVILGIPARWLILRTHTLPPVDPQSALSMLALQVEAATAPELGEMLFDFSGQSSELKPTTVTLIGLAKLWKNRLLALTNSAGLKAIAITPSAAALAAAAAPQGDGPLVLSISPEVAELAAVEGHRITLLRHLGASAPIPSLAAELRRTLAMLPIGLEPRVNSPVSGTPRALILRDDAALTPSDIQTLQDAAGIPLDQGNPPSLAPALTLSDLRGVAAPLALAQSILPGRRPDIDFLHPRLAPPSRGIATQRTVWISATAATIAILALLVYVDVSSKIRENTRLDERLHSLEPALAIARPFVADMQLAEGFQRGKPKSLACLLDITLMLPEDGQTYLSSFHLQANMKGELIGRSGADKDVVNLVDKLGASGRFAGLKPKIEGRGTGTEITYSITFIYIPRQ